jgi:hypothetical protein
MVRRSRLRNPTCMEGVSLAVESHGRTSWERTNARGDMATRRERISQFIRDAIQVLTECQGLFPPLQTLLGQLMITSATVFGLVYVFRLLTR